MRKAPRRMRWTQTLLKNISRLPVLTTRSLKVTSGGTLFVDFENQRLGQLELPKLTDIPAQYTVSIDGISDEDESVLTHARHSGITHRFNLAPGMYRVALGARVGKGSGSKIIELGRETIKVPAGGLVTSKLRPNFTWLTAKCDAPASASGFKSAKWTVFRVGDDKPLSSEVRQGSAGCTGAAWRVPLSAGSYRVKCRESTDTGKAEFAAETIIKSGQKETAVKLQVVTPR